MSDLTAAIGIVPFLILLTLALEGTRIGCASFGRRMRQAKPQKQRSPEETAALHRYGSGEEQGSAS